MHSIITFALGGEGGPPKYKTDSNRVEEGLCQYKFSRIRFLIQYLVLKLLAVFTGVFVSFMKTPVLLCLSGFFNE